MLVSGGVTSWGKSCFGRDIKCNQISQQPIKTSLPTDFSGHTSPASNPFTLRKTLSLVAEKIASRSDHRILRTVLVVGGRDSIRPPTEGKEYTWYISGIYCQLGENMLPTTFLQEPP